MTQHTIAAVVLLLSISVLQMSSQLSFGHREIIFSLLYVCHFQLNLENNKKISRLRRTKAAADRCLGQ